MFNPGSVRQGEQYVPCPPLGELAAMELSVAWVRACLLEGEEGEGVGEITTAQMSMVFHNYFVNLEGRLQGGGGGVWGLFQKNVEDHGRLRVHMLTYMCTYMRKIHPKCTTWTNTRASSDTQKARSWVCIHVSIIQGSVSPIVRPVCSVRLGEADWSWRAQTQINCKSLTEIDCRPR